MRALEGEAGGSERAVRAGRPGGAGAAAGGREGGGGRAGPAAEGTGVGWGSGGRWGEAEPSLRGDRVQQMENTDMRKNSNNSVKNSIW